LGIGQVCDDRPVSLAALYRKVGEDLQGTSTARQGPSKGRLEQVEMNCGDANHGSMSSVSLPIWPLPRFPMPPRIEQSEGHSKAQRCRSSLARRLLSRRLIHPPAMQYFHTFERNETDAGCCRNAVPKVAQSHFHVDDLHYNGKVMVEKSTIVQMGIVAEASLSTVKGCSQQPRLLRPIKDKLEDTSIANQRRLVSIDSQKKMRFGFHLQSPD